MAVIVALHAHTIVTNHVLAFTVATAVLLELYVTAHGEFVVNVFVNDGSVVSFVTLPLAKFEVGRTGHTTTVFTVKL